MKERDREYWREADRILDAILDLPADQREQRLARWPVSEVIREKVRRLLAAHDGTGPLERLPSLPGSPNAGATGAGLTGRLLGRWQLQREIGRGGMAVVYRAVSIEGPAGQPAAVKVLTIATLAGIGQRQFLHEQESLMRLRHPYIAPLFDAGIADDGTLWLAMALVDGQRIDDWCDHRSLDAPARVRLVMQVCEAVAHAHRNLVIHRDIKPSNVLVDSEGHVRLLDFGIARTIDADGEITTTVLRALTPGYAAPEQVAGALPATTMDVYGIAALLHRLIAGAPPPDSGESQVRGDLGAVIGKALAEDPAQRYSSVDALSGDLGNWLAGRPVTARAPSVRYRLGKFVARHKLLLAGATALLLVVLAGIASTVHQMRLARSEAQRAIAAQMRAETARDEANAHRKYMSRVFAVLVPSRPGDRELDRGKIIDQLASDAREQFKDQPALLSSVELDLGIIARNLEQAERSEQLLISALKRRVTVYGTDHLLVAEVQAQLGKALRGGSNPDKPRGEKLLAKAIASFRKHDAPAKVMIPALLVHAVALNEQGRGDEAWADLTEAATFCPGETPSEPLCERVLLYQGMLAGRAGRTSEAIAALRPLYALRGKRYGDAHASTLIAGSELGSALVSAGKFGEAITLLESERKRQAKVYPPDHGELVISANLLARGYLGTGRVDDARKLYQWTLARGQAIGGNNATAAHAYLQSGLLEQRDGNYSKAEELARQAHDMFVAMQGPDSPAAAATLGYRADALREMGQLDQALAMHRKSLQLTRAAFGADSPQVASRLANLARTQVLLGQPQEALTNYDAALALYRKAQQDNPGETGVAAVLAWRSRALLMLDRSGEALADLRKAVAELERLDARNQREYREAFTLLTDAACRMKADDCSQLRATSGDMSRAEQLPGRARKLLSDAADGTPLPG